MNSNKTKQYYSELLKATNKNSLTIQSPVDTSVFNPTIVTKDETISKYPGIKILINGNINPKKGHEYFIKMAAILNNTSVSDLTFIVSGRPLSSQVLYYQKLKALVSKLKINNIHFIGFSNNVPSLLKSVDIYICASVTEGSPISVWEAMSMGIPVVTTDVGDVKEYIKDGISGFVVPVKNVGLLSNRVNKLILSEKLREICSNNSRNIAVKHFDSNITAKEIEKYYRTFI